MLLILWNWLRALLRKVIGIQGQPKDTSLAGGFLLFLPIVPIIATVVSIVTYLVLNLKTPVSLTGIGWLNALLPPLFGIISTLVLWVILALACRRFTSACRANEKSYYGILNHLSTLNYYIETLPSEEEKKEIQGYRDCINQGLKKQSTSWIIGNGYIEMWNLMDSAEEALMAVAPPQKVIADAIYDEMRLNGSNIVNSEEWANKLRSAVQELDPIAVSYLKPAVGTQLAPPVSQLASPPLPTEEAEARAVLRVVRETINEFNTNSWDALISDRRQLFSTMTLVGLTMFVFVALAILFHIKPLHLEVATFFALIGGLAGLIGRLSIESQSDKTIDDYRLSMARLLVTPLLGGLAAVLGVLVVSKTTDLNSIYTFKDTLVPNLIIAATFGLTPNLLINQLQAKANEYQKNLQSTQTTTGK